jgi:carboxyl-terminal processing protease
MKKRFAYACYLAALATYLAVGTNLYRAVANDQDDPYPQLEVFTRVLERVRRDYVDGDKLTYRDLIQGALKGMLGTLDPHSEYMEPTKYNELKEDTEGEFSGVGIQVGFREGYLSVIAPMEDTPAFAAGILPGDVIEKIDGYSTANITQTEAVRRLRGVPGSKVTLTVSRSSWNEPRDIPLARADIRVYSVKDIDNRRQFPLDTDKMGYVRLTQFGEKTADELEDALAGMERQGLRGLVMDLRGNPGGLLEQAVLVCSKFLKDGQLVVSTEGRNPGSDSRRYADGSGRKRLNLPLVVLVNGSSASAAEIVTGCLKDLKRAVIVGETTFGKGSVQNILPLPNGSALRLTTAKYYTPSHQVIHEHGVTPDIVAPLREDEEIAIQLRRMPGGEANLEDVLKAYEPERREALRALVKEGRDPQLERARDLLKGAQFFGRQSEGSKKPSEGKPLN